MKANREHLPNLLADLSADQVRQAYSACKPYIDLIVASHDDGPGLYELLEQLLLIDAIGACHGRMAWPDFHRQAARYSDGTHGLCIRLADGTYSSDDEFTLPRGTKITPDADFGPDICSTRAVARKIEAVGLEGSASVVVAEDFDHEAN